jgi:hypothetical protein
MSTRNKDKDKDKGGANAEDGAVGLTFEQQQSLIKLQVEAEERRVRLQTEAEERRAQVQAEAVREQLRLVQAQIELANAQAAIPVAQPAQQQPAVFRVTDAIRMVPVFDDHDIDLYVSNFEKLAVSQNWPRAQWAAVLMPMLKGAKSLRALNRLRPEEVSDYDALKKAISEEYELVPEAYRNRFRSCVKRQGDSFSDFNQFMCTQFSRWLASVDATNDIEVLKNVICMEQFMSKCPDDIRQYLLDKNCKTAQECAKRADEYVTMHKNLRKGNQSYGGGKGDASNKYSNNGNGVHKFNDKPGNNVVNRSVNDSNGNSDHKFQKLCYVCHKPGHIATNCPNKFDNRSKGVNLVMTQAESKESLCVVEVISKGTVCDEVGQYVFPVCFYDDKNSKCVSVLGFRDSGADVTLVKSGTVPDNFLSPLNKNMLLEFANGSNDSVPLYCVNVATAGVCGEMSVGLVPDNYKFPCNAQVLIGNDYGVKLSNVGAVTRSQTRATSSVSPNNNELVESKVTTDNRPDDDSNAEVEMMQDEVNTNSGGEQLVVGSEFVCSVVPGSVSAEWESCVGVDEEEEFEPTLLDTPVPVDFDKLLGSKTAHLSKEQRSELCSIIKINGDVISDRPGCFAGYEHIIKLKAGAEPVRLSPYRMSPQQQARLKTEIDQLLAEDLIEHSDSEWSSPTILVPKPGGAVRCVIDYRQVNKKVVDNVFPIRRIDDLIERVGKSKFLTKLDLSKGFHQVLLNVNSRPITAFCTPFGQYQWKRLPFGLKTSPMNFSSRLSKVLEGLDVFCCAYIDDIVIGSDTWDDHVTHVSTVLSRLRNAGLTVKLSKCEFACETIECVGHRIGQGAMSPKEAKVKALLEAPRPKGKRDLQRLLGLANYYRRYISNFSELVLPLTEMMSKRVKFVWSSEAERSFEQIKQRLTSTPVLMIADFDRPFYLFVDASNYCVGACLAQKDKCDVFRPVCYFSKKMNGAQKNYSTSDKEGLALVLAVRAFRSYLSDKVIVFTDHEPLRYMHSMAATNQRLLRWCLELQAYNLEIQHIAGKNNVIADYLSRPCDVISNVSVNCVVQSNILRTTSGKVRSGRCSCDDANGKNDGVRRPTSKLADDGDVWCLFKDGEAE